MRLARLIHESLPFPTIALERDGALYDVIELERRLFPRRASSPIASTADFFARVIALGGAGLDELDDRLLAGDRPTEARLLPGSFVWLPPCDTDRALFLQIVPGVAKNPRFRFGNPRGLLGHDTTVPFPARETRPTLELGVAAILAEDIRRATKEEAARAIFGYAILNDWTARDAEEQGEFPPLTRDFATQLGPLLVSRSEAGDLSRLRAQIRVNGEVIANGIVGAAVPNLLAEAIAFASHYVELHGGDVIGTPVQLASTATRSLHYGSTVELLIERLGKLTGCPVRGPEFGAIQQD